MIQIKPFAEIFKTDGDRTTFIKLFNDASSTNPGRSMGNAMRTYTAGGPKNPSYLKAIKEKYSVIKDEVSDTDGSNLLENLAQSTGIDKLDIYSLYFRNLVARHSVENSSLLTDGIAKMLSCKTADELNALGVETFGDEWPVSRSTHSATHTLKACDNCVNFIKFPGCGSELPVFSAPIPYPELYDSVSDEDLPSYAADLTAAVVLMRRMLVRAPKRDFYLLDTVSNPTLFVKAAFDDSIKLQAADKNILEVMEHLLFICLVEVRRAASTENCTVSNPLYLEALEEFMIKQGLGEEYLYMAMRCKCSFKMDDSILLKLGVDHYRGIPLFSVAQLEIQVDRGFMNRTLADNKAFINNIMMPLLKGEYIKPCIIPRDILGAKGENNFEGWSYAFLDIPSPKVHVGVNSMIKYLMNPSDTTPLEDDCPGVYPAIYVGGVDYSWYTSIPSADDGKKCFRCVQSVGSLINNPAFGEDEIFEVGDNFENGNSVVDGLFPLLYLHRLCGDDTKKAEPVITMQKILKLSTGKDAESIESSVMDGTAKLALIVHAGKIYNLGTYLSAGVQISLIFQMPDYDGGEYYFCVDTEEQKEIVDGIIQEALKNSDNPEEFKYLIHVCGKVTDPVWLLGGKLFGPSIVWSDKSLPEELVNHTALLALLAYKYIDSHYGTEESKSLIQLIDNQRNSRDAVGVLCACTMLDKQLELYAADDFDMEEHFVIAAGSAGMARFQTITGNVMRRRGYCYLTTECLRLMPDGTLKAEIPNKGVYFTYFGDGIYGAFYISEGYMKMLYLTELAAYMPAIKADYETILALPYQARLRLAHSLSAGCLGGGR